ncbi:MAG TPA: methyltransferase [Prolixibacteraceae bacterium]|nr:methyltransferase [Prolixibacteraceae bacterium]
MTEVHENILPSEYAEKVGLDYASQTSDTYKKEKGQFFTSRSIAHFMASLAQPRSGHISILDPGCGLGILCCSLIEYLVKKDLIQKIDLELYETDLAVCTHTKEVISYLGHWLHKQGIELNSILHKEDFILANSTAFMPQSLFGSQQIKKFDYIISNPPYFKISKSDQRAQIAEELVYGQPNIYALFMGLSSKLLNQMGELVVITPRSFAAGNYFQAFRKVFFNEVSITDIHIFESRNKMFKRDNVLQENIIIKATRKRSANINLSVSESEADLSDSSTSVYKTEELIDQSSKEKILFIPSNSDEAETIQLFRNWKSSLNDYNIQISTGPVVAFRCEDYLVSDFSEEANLIPLLWLHNIKEMEFIFPLRKGEKPCYIQNSDEARKVLLKNKNYILIRRFSSKEDKSRLICAPYFESQTNSDWIGLENHLNYIHRPNGELSEDEVWGISALFNSSLFDTYFRTFNGNTQVGASELKQIKMPPHQSIIEIGQAVKKIENPRRNDIDKIINNTLLLKYYDQNRRSSGDFARIGVA